MIIAVFGQSCEQNYLIGCVVPPESWSQVGYDEEEIMGKLWDEWRATHDEPDTDSQFIDWLIKEKDFKPTPDEVTYVTIDT